jgi:hypothetical protein
MTKQELTSQLADELTVKDIRALLKTARTNKKGQKVDHRHNNPGRPVGTLDPDSTSGVIRDLLASGMAPMDVARELDIRPQFVYGVRSRM